MVMEEQENTNGKTNKCEKTFQKNSVSFNIKLKLG
jgi:hypothetical protein